MATETPISGNPGTWPTAQAINTRIAMSEKSNGRTSPLHNMGNDFIALGTQYGINPGFVVALLQRESQLGADGSLLPTRCNNFGGNTWVPGADPQGSSGKCAAASGIHGREWKQYSSARAGLDGVFKNLNSTTYRSTGGTASGVIEKYAPAFENDHNAIFMTFSSVASTLGITLDKNTNIYTGLGTGIIDGVGAIVGNPVQEFIGWVVPQMQHTFARLFLVTVGVGVLIIGLRKVV